ncbi:hypothetical protein KDRO_D03730 [Kluyveromyces lactis]|nr:hypothetical protein KDRO_D03730 [Kluyveromyces lactis]
MTRSEKEKMLIGEPYLCMDPELVEERLKARRLVYDFNQSKPEDEALRERILDKLLGKHDNAFIEPNFRCDYGSNITVGKNFYANFDCIMLDVCKIEIGDDVLLGPGVHIYTASHALDPIERSKGVEFGIPVKIGNRVWIGGNVTILPGVTIGDNAVIGSGSVITKDVDANVVVAGNPAKFIKHIELNKK